MDLVLDKNCPSLIQPDVTVALQDDVYLACMLNQADVVNNCNKFYAMQLLSRKDGFSYFLMTRSGRVGYEGTITLECYTDKERAICDFMLLFKEKTGFPWEKRGDHSKIDGKYDYIEMKYESTDVDELKRLITDSTRLDSQVEYLMGLIFDEKTFKAAATRLGLDVSRAPLGAISGRQIQKAYAVLAKIANEIASPSPSSPSLQTLSSEFYTIIPTKFGMGPPPVLDTDLQLQNKIELLKILDDTEFFGRLHSTGAEIGLDQKYLALDTKIQPLTDRKMYDLLTTYMQTTSASGHNLRLRVHNIFSVERTEERTRFKKWENMHNRQLLWHGSGISNYVGILSTGLRINPGNVVKSGSMFGNGLYFANCSSKSANYMKTNDIGIMILCEVALGTCYEQTAANYIKSLPPGYHSCQGVGNMTPLPAEYTVLADGVIVPTGKLISRNMVNSLCYDEFIVYDQSQVRIKYLFVVGVNG